MQSFSSVQWSTPLVHSSARAAAALQTQQSAKSSKRAPAGPRTDAVHQTGRQSKLFTIREENHGNEKPNNSTPTAGQEADHPNSVVNPTQVKSELSNLRRQCAKLQSQRDEAYTDLEAALASVTITDAHTHRQENIQLKSQLSELESKNRVLQERCKTLAAWAEQHRAATTKLKDLHQQSESSLKLLQSKHESALQALQRASLSANSANPTNPANATNPGDKFTLDSLTEALANADRMHTTLEKEHAQLKSRCSFLEQKLQSTLSDLAASRANLDTAQQTLKATRERAINAERELQGLVGLKALLKSAPVSTHISNRASGVLQSAVDVLTLAEKAPQDQLGGCLTQVSAALSRLEEDIAGHAAASQAWASKREIMLRPQSTVDD